MTNFRQHLLLATALCLLPLAAMAGDTKAKDGTTERYIAPTDQVVGPSPANPQHTEPRTGPGRAAELGQPAPASADPATVNDDAPRRAIAEQLLNRPIKNAEGSTIGRISGVAMNKDGQVDTVIVAVGGFFGIGGHDVMLNWSELKSDVSASTDIMVAMTEDELENQPRYEYKNARQRGTVFDGRDS